MTYGFSLSARTCTSQIHIEEMLICAVIFTTLLSSVIPPHTLHTKILEKQNVLNKNLPCSEQFQPQHRSQRRRSACACWQPECGTFQQTLQSCTSGGHADRSAKPWKSRLGRFPCGWFQCYFRTNNKNKNNKKMSHRKKNLGLGGSCMVNQDKASQDKTTQDKTKNIMLTCHVQARAP